MAKLNQSIQEACYKALMATEPSEKCQLVAQLYSDFNDDELSLNHSEAETINTPGKPDTPELVAPRLVKKRGFAKQSGRNNLMHAMAHIEFNAINLALDAAYRFSGQPKQYYADWVRVAFEESKHFQLVCDYLAKHGLSYGDLPAHDGLWDMCKRTNHDLLARMALVPRVLEARGLDVTPSIIEKLIQFGDPEAADVLNVIYHDEIEHVRIGSHWFIQQCELRSAEPQETFLDCVDKYLHGELRGPFNLTARQKAGFTAGEIANLQKIMDDQTKQSKNS